MRVILVIWDWSPCVSLWVDTLNPFLEHITIYFDGLHTCYHSCYCTFMKVLYHYQRATIISSLLHKLLYSLLYIFHEISTYLHDFQSVTTRYHQFLLKKKYIKPNLCWPFRGLFLGEGSKIMPQPTPTPCLKIVRIMLKTWNFLCKYTHVCSFRKYTC